MASLLRSVLSIFSGKFVGILISLAFTPILVRIISQEQYGLFASIFAGFTIVTLLTKGGIFDATRKTVAEHSDNDDAVSSIVSTAFIISIFYGVISMSLIIIALQTDIIPAKYKPYIWILALGVLAVNLFSTARGSLYGLQRESVGEVLQISRRLLYALVGLGLAYFGFEVAGVFIGYVLSFAVIGVAGIAILSKYLSYSFISYDEIGEYGREIASFGGYQLIGGLSATLLYKSDILLVEFFRGETATALYQSAIVPAEMIWFVPQVIQLAFLQHTASLWSDRKIEEIEENLKTGLKYAILSLTLFGTGLFALSEPFLNVYFGPDYVAASLTLKILIIGTFFLGTSRVVVPVLEATGLVKESQLITFAGLVINLVLNALLIPRFGIIGAGIGTATSYACIFLGNISLWDRSQFSMVSIQWIGRLFIVQSIFTAIFLTVVFMADTTPLISLILFPIVGLLLFLITNIAAGYIPTAILTTRIQALTDF